MNIFKSEPEKDLTEEGRRQLKARLALFVRSFWPDLMKADPPKTEEVTSQVFGPSVLYVSAGLYCWAGSVFRPMLVGWKAKD